MIYLEAIFLKEKTNRFFVEVLFEGEVLGCYLPYSSKLAVTLSPYGKKVLLLPIKGKRFKYKIVALIDEGNVYYLDLNTVNTLFEESRIFEYFNNYSCEKTVTNNYRADFINNNSKQVLEIKTILSPSTTAIYPNVNPVRFYKQLKELSSLIKEGYLVTIVFILLNKNIQQISFNNKYFDFTELFFSLLKNKCDLHIHEIEYENIQFRISPEKKYNIDFENYRITIAST